MSMKIDSLFGFVPSEIFEHFNEEYPVELEEDEQTSEDLWVEDIIGHYASERTLAGEKAFTDRERALFDYMLRVSNRAFL